MGVTYLQECGREKNIQNNAHVHLLLSDEFNVKSSPPYWPQKVHYLQYVCSIYDLEEEELCSMAEARVNKVFVHKTSLATPKAIALDVELLHPLQGVDTIQIAG